MKKYKNILLCILLAVSICFTGCEDNGNKNDNVFDDDVIPVAGTPEAEETEGEYTKRVALTFDDGPHNIHTKAIVDELTKYGYNATFFVIGNRIDGSEYNGSSALKYAYEAGNEIGIHGYTHTVYYSSCTDEELRDEMSKTETAIKSKINGISVLLVRPIGGFITDERVKTSNYSIIMWNVDSEDWKNKYSNREADENADAKVNTIVENIMSNVQDGSIILMHDIYQSTSDAVVVLLERLHNEGYDVVTVSELIGNDLAAGKKYYNG